MPKDIKKISRDYYGEMKRAYKTKELYVPYLHLDENVKLIGTNEYFEGKTQVIDVFEKIIPMMRDLEVLHEYFDHHSSCSIVCRTSIFQEIQIISADRLVFMDGSITEIYIYYDTQAWHHLIKKLQNLSSSAAFFQIIGTVTSI